MDELWGRVTKKANVCSTTVLPLSLLYYGTPLLRTALKVPRLERDRGTNPALYARRWCLLSFISIKP